MHIIFSGFMVSSLHTHAKMTKLHTLKSAFFSDIYISLTLLRIEGYGKFFNLFRKMGKQTIIKFTKKALNTYENRIKEMYFPNKNS